MRPCAKRARAPWTVGSEQSLSPLDIDILLSYMFSPRSTRLRAPSLLSCLFLSFFLLNLFFSFSCLIPCTIISRRRLRQTRPCKLLFSATNYLVALLASFLPSVFLFRFAVSRGPLRARGNVPGRAFLLPFPFVCRPLLLLLPCPVFQATFLQCSRPPFLLSSVSVSVSVSPHASRTRNVTQ